MCVRGGGPEAEKQLKAREYIHDSPAQLSCQVPLEVRPDIASGLPMRRRRIGLLTGQAPASIPYGPIIYL